MAPGRNLAKSPRILLRVLAIGLPERRLAGQKTGGPAGERASVRTFRYGYPLARLKALFTDGHFPQANLPLPLLFPDVIAVAHLWLWAFDGWRKSSPLLLCQRSVWRRGCLCIRQQEALSASLPCACACVRKETCYSVRIARLSLWNTERSNGLDCGV